jgi:hypothetical protein
VFTISAALLSFGKNLEAKANIGDVVHFNGFTSLHYNTSVASEHRSLVIHNTMPFEKTKIARWIDTYSRYRVKK